MKAKKCVDINDMDVQKWEQRIIHEARQSLLLQFMKISLTLCVFFFTLAYIAHRYF